MTDETGTIVWSAKAEAFGQTYISTNTITNNLRFPGQYFDEETGLHYNWNRYYNPTTGRYITADPIGFAGGDVNLYRYVGNRAVGWVDPWGLHTQELGLTVGLDVMGFSGGLSVTIAKDDDGGWGLVIAPTIGGAYEARAFMAQVIYGVTDADTIDDLKGKSTSVTKGGSFLLGGANISNLKGKGYEGTYVSAGFEWGLVPYNYSEEEGTSMVINFSKYYDATNKYLMHLLGIDDDPCEK